jgi:malonyl-CoA O-methyltransferase
VRPATGGCVTPGSAAGSGFVDAAAVRRRFSALAPRYDETATIEREIGRRLLGRLDCVRLVPQRIVDLGCAAGAAAPALRARYPQAEVIGVDSSPAMLAAARRGRSVFSRLLPFMKAGRIRSLCADAAALPLRAASAQMVWSNLLLPWVDDPLPVFREARRVLAPQGLLLFATLGPDTLKELRAAFADGRAHTQRFPDMHDLGDQLVAAGLIDPVMEMEMLTVTYPSLDALFAELRAAGPCAMRDRPRGLSGKGAWAAMRARYPRQADGRFPATLEIVYGHAWRGEAKQDADGRPVVRFMPRPPR